MPFGFFMAAGGTLEDKGFQLLHGKSIAQKFFLTNPFFTLIFIVEKVFNCSIK
jgi:hypothetical protein